MLRVLANGTENPPKNPAVFNVNSPGKVEEKNHNIFWRAGKVKLCLPGMDWIVLLGTVLLIEQYELVMKKTCSTR